MVNILEKKLLETEKIDNKRLAEIKRLKKEKKTFLFSFNYMTNIFMPIISFFFSHLVSEIKQFFSEITIEIEILIVISYCLIYYVICIQVLKFLKKKFSRFVTYFRFFKFFRRIKINEQTIFLLGLLNVFGFLTLVCDIIRFLVLKFLL